MFVSILQRFGFSRLRHADEPLQSRADQNTRTTESGGSAGSVAEDHPQATSMKRLGVNAQAKTPDKPQQAAKANAKPTVKPAMPNKTATKPIVKVAKPVAGEKVAVKKPAQTLAKAVMQAVIPEKVTAPKATAKAAAKAAAAPVTRSVALKGKVASTTPPLSKTPVKAPAAVKAAKSLKEAPSASSAGIGKKTTLPTTAPAPQPAPHPTERSKSMTSPPALKPGRRSSARAPSQLPPPAPMVPTHAPDAAKASYSVMTERVIAPPPHVAAKKDPKLANNWKSKTADELTDDEVKAMPDTEYMNDKQMAFFRHKLSVLKQEIHNSAGETTEHLREETVVVPDPADRATIEEEHALELRTRDRERKLLKKIEQSIGRIDSGDYGYCDETGEPIGVGRLIARPTANLSLEAQQRRELKQKMFGD